MSWNPFSAGAPHLTPHHLASAKLLALAAADAVAQKALTQGGAAGLETAAGWVALAAAWLLWFNRRPRWMMALLAPVLAVSESSGGLRFPQGNFGIPAGLLLLAAMPLQRASIGAAAVLYWASVVSQAIVAPSALPFLGFPVLVGCLVALSALRPYPSPPPVVIWDGACGLCHLSRRWLSRLDTDRLLVWKTLQSNPQEAAGVPAAVLSARLHVRWGPELLRGYDAVKRVVLGLPATLFLLALAGLLGRLLHPYLTPLLTLAFLLFTSPWSNWPGRRLYDWVARNRRRWGKDEPCPVPHPPGGDQPPLA